MFNDYSIKDKRFQCTVDCMEARRFWTGILCRSTATRSSLSSWISGTCDKYQYECSETLKQNRKAALSVGCVGPHLSRDLIKFQSRNWHILEFWKDKIVSKHHIWKNSQLIQSLYWAKQYCLKSHQEWTKSNTGPHPQHQTSHISGRFHSTLETYKHIPLIRSTIKVHHQSKEVVPSPSDWPHMTFQLSLTGFSFSDVSVSHSHTLNELLICSRMQVAFVFGILDNRTKQEKYLYSCLL